MRRLSRDEREIRKSAGIHVGRLWPFLVMLVADLVVSADGQLFQRCVGSALDGRGRGPALIRAILAMPCGLSHPDGTLVFWAPFALFWLAVPFAVRETLWMRRHRAYWDRVRAKQKLRRAEKKALRAGKDGKADGEAAR